MMQIRNIFGMMCLLCASPLTLAKDVSAQQAGVAYAQNEMDAAERQYQNKSRRVTDSEKRLELAQKELAENRQQLQAAQAEKEVAQNKLTHAHELLDKAWQQ